MSKFDFKAFRQQVIQTNNLLRKQFKATDNMLQGIANRDADPEFQKGQKTRAQNRSDEWRSKKTSSSRQLAQDPTWQANQKIGAEKRRATVYDNEDKKKAAMLKRESNQDYQKKRAESNRLKAQDPVYLGKVQAGVAKRDQDPDYQAKLAQGRYEKSLRKGWIVTPAGIHLKQSESAEANNIAVGTLQTRIKKDPKHYYYITNEQYLKLKK